MPKFLELLDRLELRITVFVVGQDAALSKNHAPLKAIAEAGHQIGNHSFHHEPWMHRNSAAEVAGELRQAHEAIEAATGVAPQGYRGPGYSLSLDILRSVKRLGYAYDASTFPSALGPLARAYYFRKARLSAEEREARKDLFGGFTEAFRPLRAYHWELPEGALLEIPVTTMPLLRAPFHVSYLIYLSARSHWLAQRYLKLALTLCRLGGVQPSLLLHPLDFLGADEVADLAFFPGMELSGARKRAWVEDYLKTYRDHFEVVTMEEHARRIGLSRLLSQVRPRFTSDSTGAQEFQRP